MSKAKVQEFEYKTEMKQLLHWHGAESGKEK